MFVLLPVFLSMFFATDYQTTRIRDNQELFLNVSIEGGSTAERQIKIAYEKLQHAQTFNQRLEFDLNQMSSDEIEEIKSQYFEDRSQAYFEAACNYHETVLRIIERTVKGELSDLFRTKSDFGGQMDTILMAYLESAQETIELPIFFDDYQNLWEAIKVYEPEYLEEYKTCMLSVLSYVPDRLVVGYDYFDYEIMALNFTQKSLTQKLEIYESWNLEPSDYWYAQRLWVAKDLVRINAIKGASVCDSMVFLNQIDQWISNIATEFNSESSHASLSVNERNGVSLTVRATLEIEAFTQYMAMESSDEDSHCQSKIEISRYSNLINLLPNEDRMREDANDNTNLSQGIVQDLQEIASNYPDLKN